MFTLLLRYLQERLRVLVLYLLLCYNRIWFFSEKEEYKDTVG